MSVEVTFRMRRNTEVDRFLIGKMSGITDMYKSGIQDGFSIDGNAWRTFGVASLARGELN